MRNASSITTTETDAGFIRSLDREAARRQFNMSLGLVVALSLATLASALTLRIEPAAGPRETTARIIVQAPQIVHVRQAETRSLMQPGG